MYFNLNGIKNFTKYLYYNNLCKNSEVEQLYLCDKDDFTIFKNNKIISVNETDVINLNNNTAITIPKNITFIINDEIQNENNDFWIIKLVV